MEESTAMKFEYSAQNSSLLITCHEEDKTRKVSDSFFPFTLIKKVFNLFAY
jgi:hypothetical protein